MSEDPEFRSRPMDCPAPARKVSRLPSLIFAGVLLVAVIAVVIGLLL